MIPSNVAFIEDHPMNPYIPVLILMAVGLTLGGALSGLAGLFGPKRPSTLKNEPVECGLPRVTDSREKMSVKFYLTAILFILFDIETVFLYLWAKTFDRLGMFGLIEGFVFIAILFVGYVYVWKRGALEWD